MIRARLIATFVAVCVLGVLGLKLRQMDLEKPPRFLPKCAVHELTGFHCPGCGNTRAAHALLHGDVTEALRQNAILVIALPFFVFFVWHTWREWVAPGRSLTEILQQRRWQLVFAVVALIAFTILRNLPMPPFQWLAPDPPKIRASPAFGALAIQYPDGRPGP